MDADAFWLEDVASLSEAGWDPPLGYMKAMLDLTKNNGALSSLKNSDLFELGQTLDFYEGVRQFLDQIPVYLGSRPAMFFRLSSRRTFLKVTLNLTNLFQLPNCIIDLGY